MWRDLDASSFLNLLCEVHSWYASTNCVLSKNAQTWYACAILCIHNHFSTNCPTDHKSDEVRLVGSMYVKMYILHMCLCRICPMTCCTCICRSSSRSSCESLADTFSTECAHDMMAFYAPVVLQTEVDEGRLVRSTQQTSQYNTFATVGGAEPIESNEHTSLLGTTPRGDTAI